MVLPMINKIIVSIYHSLLHFCALKVNESAYFTNNDRGASHQRLSCEFVNANVKGQINCVVLIHMPKVYDFLY